jgi:hypothetical protein
VVKAEAKDLTVFFSRRQDPAPATHSYPSVPSSQSLQADWIPEYEYDTSYSRPASSISSTPTYAYDGPYTPYRSKSPMNMNEIVSGTIAREASPDPPEVTSLVARNSYRVKRKTLPSPKSPPRSIPEPGHRRVEKQESGIKRRSRVGSMDASYAPSLDPYAESESGHTQTAMHEAHGIEPLKPSRLQFRTHSNAGSYTSSGASHSHSEIVPAYGAEAHPASLVPGSLGPSLLPDSQVGDVEGPISPMSLTSSSNTGFNNTESLTPNALNMGHRAQSPSPVQTSETPNSPTSPMSPPSYSETNLRNRADEKRQFELPPLPVQAASDVGIPFAQGPLSSEDDCTLELVHHLPESERKASEAHYATGQSIPPPPSRQAPGFPDNSRQDIEPGLELAPSTRSTPPATDHSHYRPYSERPIEPDAASIRPSIRSSNSVGKSKFGFLKRFGGSSRGVDSVPSLPSNLQFCFSICSRSLLLWSKKDSDIIVQIKHPFKTGRRLDLGNSREPYSNSSGQRKGFSIRLVTASSQIVAAYACANKVCLDRNLNALPRSSCTGKSSLCGIFGRKAALSTSW